MDIEGSEFFVLRQMIEEKTICKIKDIYIEFHERFMPNESSQSRIDIINEITKLGTTVHEWF